MKKYYFSFIIPFLLYLLSEPSHSILCGTHLTKKKYRVEKFMPPPTLDKSLETTNFIIRYTTNSNNPNCVRNPTVDNYSWNNDIPNRHPDYVDDIGKYLEHSLDYLINRLGYLPPPKRHPTDKYQVLVKKHEDCLNCWGACDFVNGEVIIYIHPTMKMAFQRPNDDPEGVIKGALKVTCAHELFHGVQAAYDWEEDKNYNFWFAEATAVWIEDIIYDEVNDYISYIEAVFHHPEKSLECCNVVGDKHRYGSVIFIKYLTERFANNNIIKEIWEECKTDTTQRSMNVIEKVIENRGSTLRQIFKDFTICNYFKNYKDGTHPKFPSVKTMNYQIKHPTDNFIIEFDGKDNFEWNLLLLKFKQGNNYEKIDCNLDAWNRTTQNINLLDGNINQILMIPSNTSINPNYQTKLYYDYSYGSISKKNYVYPFGANYILFQLSPIATITRTFTLPNPARDNIYFYAELINYSPHPTYATIEIYDIRGNLLTKIYDNQPNFQSPGKYYYKWTDGGKNLPNGVYLFRIKFDNNIAKVGKFVVIK